MAYEQPDPEAGGTVTPDLRHAAPSPTNTRSCGTQPAYISLDRASITTRTGAPSPTGLHNHEPRNRPTNNAPAARIPHAT